MTLKELKIGSKVVVENRLGSWIGTIKRETKTQWIIGSNRYRKRDGGLVGETDRWGFTSIRPATEVDIENSVRFKLVVKLTEITKKHLEDVSTDILKEVVKLLNLNKET